MADLGLAVVSTVNNCLQWGSKVVDLCKSYEHADEEIKAHLVRLEAGWFKTKTQLDFMKQISGEMDAYHLKLNLRTTEQLNGHFTKAWNKLHTEFEMPDGEESYSFRRLRRIVVHSRYALLKDSIEATLTELEKWHSIVDPSWYLLLRLSNTTVNTTLARYKDKTANSFLRTEEIRHLIRTDSSHSRSGIFLPSKEMENMVIRDLPFCTAQMAQRKSSHNGTQNLILTTLECPTEARVDFVAKEVRELAAKLAVTDPKTFGMLACKGVVKKSTDCLGYSPTSFIMVFRCPDNQASVSSLRSKLLLGDNSITLGDRFTFARQIAKAVSYIHTLEFVHKSIRPENILIFQNPVPAAYLAGFDHFRKDGGWTHRRGMHEWEKNLYIHPSRQGLAPKEDYIMQHDIYSLGVCLLEIGLWESFAVYATDGKEPTPSQLLRSAGYTQNGQVNFIVKDCLLKLCQDYLPQRMGRKYAEVVQTCLTCLDPGNSDFGDQSELVDSDGIVVGVTYIEKILYRLSEISF